jgi:hypothetical protein
MNTNEKLNNAEVRARQAMNELNKAWEAKFNAEIQAKSTPGDAKAQLALQQANVTFAAASREFKEADDAFFQLAYNAQGNHHQSPLLIFCNVMQSA